MSQSIDYLALVINALIALIQVKLYVIFLFTPFLLSLNVHKIFSIIFLTFALIVLLCQDSKHMHFILTGNLFSQLLTFNHVK